MCYRTGKYTVCRRVCAYFSLAILQAGAVKGLNTRYINSTGDPSSNIKTTQSRKEKEGEKMQVDTIQKQGQAVFFWKYPSYTYNCVCVCICVCVRACVHVCVCVCVLLFSMFENMLITPDGNFFSLLVVRTVYVILRRNNYLYKNVVSASGRYVQRDE